MEFRGSAGVLFDPTFWLIALKLVVKSVNAPVYTKHVRGNPPFLIILFLLYQGPVYSFNL